MPPVRIELTTPGLQDQCSATELKRLFLCLERKDKLSDTRDKAPHRGDRRAPSLKRVQRPICPALHLLQTLTEPTATCAGKERAMDLGQRAGGNSCQSYQLDTESRVAQWKRAGPITQRSVDRNYALLGPIFSLQPLESSRRLVKCRWADTMRPHSSLSCARSSPGVGLTF